MANSPILAIPLLAANQTAKETTINDAINYLEKSLNDFISIDFTAGHVVLALVDLQRYFMFRATNVLGPRNLTINSTAKRIFALDNTAGSDAVTVIQGANSVVCATGEVYVIACNGTTLKFLYDSSNTLTQAFTSLSDVPSDYVGMGGFLVRVNVGETGLEFADPDLGTIGFLNLTDTPSSYTGEANKLPIVKDTEDGLEFISIVDLVHRSIIVEEGTVARTLATADVGKVIRFTNDAAVTATVPTHASDPIPEGSQIHLRQVGDGPVEILPDTGVVVNTPSTLFTAGQHATVTIIKIDDNEWDIFGALSPL